VNDLDASDEDIVAENLHAVQQLYYAYQLERMRVFQVVERIAELSQQGMLPLSTGPAIERWHRVALRSDRLSDSERATLYARALGVPGGATGGDVEPNRDFCSLWLRFVASVAMCARQRYVEGSLAPPTPANADVREAARCLAVNSSLHGWGMTLTAASLQDDIRALRTLLNEPEIKAAFGARDMWQVIDSVNTNELGGAVNVGRYRTRAQAGNTIMEWLTANADALQNPDPAAGGVAPSDSELIDAVEQWIAVSGVQENVVEQYGQPAESPTVASDPIDLPKIARDLLEAAGMAGTGSRGPPSPSAVLVFDGPTCTGKTLAAHAMAVARDLQILRIDLSRVVSQWIGETEKNLEAVFNDAERSGAILYLDEADALFGKRSDVRDAHDRYANMATAYLLQRLESYAGIAILATNLPPATDDAFADDRWRKLVRAVIRFPYPACR